MKLFRVIAKINAYLKAKGIQSTIANISEQDDEQKIKKAYKKLMLYIHPDKEHGNEELSKELSAAYNLWLNHPELADIELDDGEDEVAIDPNRPRVTTVERPRSFDFQKEHTDFISKYREIPLSNANLQLSLMPFRSDLYPGAAHVYEYIANKTRSNPKGKSLSIPNEPLTPKIAVAILQQFLSGEYYGETLQTFRRYFKEELERVRESLKGYSVLSLYQGIYQILVIDSIKANTGRTLLMAIQYMSHYAFDTVTASLAFLLPLLQSDVYRSFVSYVLHLVWRGPSTIMPANERVDFNGQEDTKAYFEELKNRMPAVKKDDKGDDALLNTIRYVGALHKFEQDLNANEHPLFSANEHRIDAEYFRKKAYYAIDWMFALVGRGSSAISINVLLQAGIYFQKASLCEREQSVQMADEQMALKLYRTAIGIAYHTTPDRVIYTYLFVIESMLSFRYADDLTHEIIKLLQEKVLELISIFPLLESTQSNVALLKNGSRSLAFLRHYLQTLIKLIDDNKTLPKEKQIPLQISTVNVLGLAYDGCLRLWFLENYDPKQEQKIRLHYMGERLAEHRWTFLDLEKNVADPWIRVARDREGWFTNINTVPFSDAEPVYSEVNGVELNYKTGEISFSLRPWQPHDLPSERRVTLSDLSEMVQKNLGAAYFSLDPDPKNPLSPFNTMRFGPDTLRKTQLGECMFLADYLLKILTVGQEVQGKYPFAMRPLDTLLEPLPPHLRRIIENFNSLDKQNNSIQQHEPHRFWIEAVEIGATDDDSLLENQGTKRFALGEMTMVVKKHKMTRTASGQLVDADEADEGWSFYCLTSEQKNELDRHERLITGRAIISIVGKDYIYFVDQGVVSLPMVVAEQREFLQRLWQQPRAAGEKVIRQTTNSWFLYRLTNTLCECFGFPHHFSPEYQFAEELTAHYDEFGCHFAPFARLKELSRMAALVRILSSEYEQTGKMIHRLQTQLQNDEHWQELQNKVDEGINSLLSKYDKDYQEDYDRVSASIHQQLPNWKNVDPSQLKNAFSMVTRPIDFSAVAMGRSEAVTKLISAIVDSNFANYKKELEAEIHKLKQVVNDQKSHLKDEIAGLQRLQQEFQSIGFGLPQEISDRSEDCLWVPASIVHAESEKQSRLVYGGVNIQSKITFFGSNSFQSNAMMNGAFAGALGGGGGGGFSGSGGGGSGGGGRGARFFTGVLQNGGGYIGGGALPSAQANNINNLDHLNRKLQILQNAQNNAAATVRTLPDGRVRYYDGSMFSGNHTPGRTAGIRMVTEHNPNTGQVRSWKECYDHQGNVTSVHPNTINGAVVHHKLGQHYPPTGKETGANGYRPR